MSDAVSAATSSERLDHALAAFLRQQMSAPVVTMIGFLDIIIEDAGRFHLDQAIPDLERMRIASAELGALVSRVIDAPESIRNENEEFDAFQSRLRHDLRTPLNAIRGYSEILIEDMQESGQQQLLQDLEKVTKATDDLLAGIDAMVDLHAKLDGKPCGQQTEQSPPLDVITDLLRVVAPVDAMAEQSFSERSSRILVVDDIAANRDLLARRLIREGHRVVIAEDGASALESLENEEFDLILLDLMMPGMNGFEVLCRLKSDQRTRHIPVIMISALDEIDSAVRCIEAGAEDYVPKPFNPILLRARIGACLEKKSLRDREQAIQKLQSARTGPTSTLLELAHVLTPGRGPTTDRDKLEQLKRDNPAEVYNQNWDARRLWLTSYQEADRTVKLGGLARDGDDVSELERRLKLSDYFTDVKLLPGVKILDSVSHQELFKFELSAKVKY